MKKLVRIGILTLTLIVAIGQTEAQTAKKALKAGKEALENKQLEEAVKFFSEAITLDPESEDAYILRAESYEKLKKNTEAITDYSKASMLKPKDEKLSCHAGRLLAIEEKHIEAIRMFNKSLEANKSYLPAFHLKFTSLMVLKNFPEALATCDLALEIEESAENYYNHGFVSESMKNDKVAETDYRNAIKADKMFKLAYVGLSNVLTRQNKNDEALKFCSDVISKYPDYSEAFVVRSGIYYRKSDLVSAISDLTSAIALNPPHLDTLYIIRAIYNHELKLYEKSISDCSKALTCNDHSYMAYYERAMVYEEIKKPKEAASDYSHFLELTVGHPEVSELITKANQKVYDLNRETDLPEVVLSSPKSGNPGTIEVALNTKTIKIEGTVKDQSQLEYIKINDKEYKFDVSQRSVVFSQEIQIADLEKVTVSASDVYHNVVTTSYKIVKTEIDPPLIDVITPYASDLNEIFLETESQTVFLEGKLADESLIKEVTVEGVEAKFIADSKNPNFSATIDITGKEKIKIRAVDIFGNVSEKNYKLNRETARILAENPMGKTWVIFIDNSNYETFASLEGPSKDITTMRSAFSKYDIHNIVEKKNMSKQQMERFFSLELRDMVKNQKVNSLLVWYAGHGKFINETGYWIPVDARRDEEFTYFNVNSLKAFMQSYTSYVTHVLVVTDACESGPSFYAAMRGAKERECSDATTTKFKSSQVFSSAGYELAADNSQFTKTFAKSLDYNTNSCIPIEKIVNNVTESVGQGSKQAPKFGKIQGLEDEDGTFFFIKKTH